MKIRRIVAREVFDSRGNPTIECQLLLEDGFSVVSCVPSGASTGSHEAVELRDGGDRFYGKGVLKAVELIEREIAPFLVNQEVDAIAMDRMLIDMDGTSHKKKLGANTTLAVSSVLYKAQAHAENAELFELIAWLFEAQSVTLPMPLFNMVNGGAHANNNLIIQEFMVVPLGAQNIRQAIEAGMLFFHELKKILHKKGKSTAVGDEGGFACSFEDDVEVLHYLTEALLKVSKKESLAFGFALDVAASQFYNQRTKKYSWGKKKMGADDMIEFYEGLSKAFPLYSIEDGLAEDDWDGWIQLYERLGNTVQIVGDDLFATNVQRITEGVACRAASAAIIKPNQIGTVTEALQAIKLCKSNGMGTIISHRSGETVDTLIADIAVGTAAGQIKAGGCCRAERVAKYNRLLTIEDILVRNMLER